MRMDAHSSGKECDGAADARGGLNSNLTYVTVQGVSWRLPFLRLNAKQEAIATAHIPRNIRRSLLTDTP